ncbi:PDR/VanB family oxidoreductase [Mesorhizobium sp. CA8]|uniref:PDR/VanB family oxidoreductase n=1 Tax=unclassified Mesorhizobium TaxID=325217 RepID=UPI001CCA49AA|nr:MULTISPECIES: PDR/VanB family oxidoreductase [unclassified Mesorhizobium]MBZ9761659.1 PDR/VanB family oxidoreductase [Mesorhizobium sp. CA8]MBZ9820587.1 PDR/VanB family oxidoreductase [Mesorhizobium sp. CA4]
MDMTHTMAGSWRKVRVSRITCETERIKAFELTPEDGQPLWSWAAGAHTRVKLPSGTVRQYSLVGDPDDVSTYRLGVLRELAGRGGSAEMHEVLCEGAVIEISAPINNFALDDEQVPHLLIAGGIGITPILSMARVLAKEGREWRLFYCTRTPADTAFLQDVRALESRCVEFVHDEGDASRGLNVLDLLRSAPLESQVYVCGPRGLIDAVIYKAKEANFQDSRIHWEAFTASGTQPKEERIAGSFEIELRRSDKILTVPPDKTILQVLRAEGIHVKSVCEEGYCGTCLTGVLEGVPDHRDDDLLTPEERESNAVMTVCCSRSKTAKLVLDL